MDVGVLWELANGLGVGALLLSRKRKRPQRPPPDHPVRDKLVSMILRRPGIRLANLWKALDANRKTTKYHLMILEGARIVSSIQRQQTIRYFPTNMPSEDRRAFAVLLRGRVLEMVVAIGRHPGIRQKDLGAALRLSRKVIRRYADLLVDTGLVAEIKDGHARQYYGTDRLEQMLPQVLEHEQPDEKAQSDSDAPGQDQAP